MSTHETISPNDVLPSTSTQLTIHQPRLIVPEACLQNCRRLRNGTGAALLKAVQYPDAQIDVVCPKNRRLGCNAGIVKMGFYATFGARIPGSDELFLRSPVIYEGGSSPTQRIADALEAGAEVHSVSDLG